MYILQYFVSIHPKKIVTAEGLRIKGSKKTSNFCYFNYFENFNFRYLIDSIQ